MATKKKVPAKSSELEFDYKTIKTFEDACKKLNVNSSLLPDVSKLPDRMAGHGMALISAYKLFIIFEAINNGWTPDWRNWNQYKYYAWFEVKALSSGFGFADSSYGCAYAHTSIGSRLCTDTSDKACYIAKTFEKEYNEYLLINH